LQNKNISNSGVKLRGQITIFILVALLAVMILVMQTLGLFTYTFGINKHYALYHELYESANDLGSYIDVNNSIAQNPNINAGNESSLCYTVNSIANPPSDDLDGLHTYLNANNGHANLRLGFYAGNNTSVPLPTYDPTSMTTQLGSWVFVAGCVNYQGNYCLGVNVASYVGSSVLDTDILLGRHFLQDRGNKQVLSWHSVRQTLAPIPSFAQSNFVPSGLYCPCSTSSPSCNCTQTGNHPCMIQ
jgi:hypothetical protein